MPGYFPTSQVSVQLTGTSSVPNNFTVDIYRWDVTTDAAVYDRTIVTGLTRTATSSVNGGTLLNGYGISGITGLDNYVKLTSTTSCSSTATYLITDAALTVYTPASGTLTEGFSGGTSPNEYIDSFDTTGMVPNKYLDSASQLVAQIDTLSYLDAADFTLSYVSGTTFSTGLVVTGTYANGPFSSFSVTKSGKTFSLFGSANTSLTALFSRIHGVMRLTYNPSGYYVDFNYHYYPWDV
jgi:hypothetical protein